MTEIRVYLVASGGIPDHSGMIIDTIGKHYRSRFMGSKLEQQKAGALAAALLLSAFAGIGREDDIVCNKYGKPFVKGKPEFSISHSDDLTVLAVSDEDSVGVDIERIGRVTPRVIRKVSNIETRALNDFDLALEWTRVEARLKLKGTGFYADPLKAEEAPACYSSCVYYDHCITCAAFSEHNVTFRLVNFEFENNLIEYKTKIII